MRFENCSGKGKINLTTDEVCITKADGTPFCLTKENVELLDKVMKDYQTKAATPVTPATQPTEAPAPTTDNSGTTTPETPATPTTENTETTAPATDNSVTPTTETPTN
jgi:hypothetical protein